MRKKNMKIKSLFEIGSDLLLEILERDSYRDLLKKGVRIYLGYWGRSLYFFLGVQVFLTAALVMANRMLP
jgi:hypothetical protein